MGASLDLYGRRRDGSEFPLDIMLSPMSSDTGGLVLAVVRDVRVEIDHAAETCRHHFGDTRDHHASIAVADEDDVLEILVEQDVDDVLDVSGQVDARPQQVCSLT